MEMLSPVPCSCAAASKQSAAFLRQTAPRWDRLRKQVGLSSSLAAVHFAATDLVLLAGVAGAAAAMGTFHGQRTRAARPGLVSRRVVDLPVREASVKTNVAIYPGAKNKLQEETRLRRADQYRLIIFSELTISFTDTDGDHIRIQRDGTSIDEYVNGRLDVRSMMRLDIDVVARTYRDDGGHGSFRSDENLEELVRKRDLMFMERDFVARCLMIVCLLKEGDAFQVMMKALTDGVAVVGTYQFEQAEAYCQGLKAKGLSADIFPVDNSE
ncbi:unnamed protein product [Polarella glacialis]|uniref:Adaptor protein ClpS core domain-containing protein n=1 Tax=Polarella glacialis TaxID=89957 RepID=A0A813KJP8_POLGL|nr:unnamed protein product [Polarella glacialis]CAE8705645.1 unnamed protein product [Polarella glacialis]